MQTNNDYYLLDCERLRMCLAAEQLKQWWVAEQAGIHQTTLRRWLKGEIHRVRRENLEGLARVLNVQPIAIVQAAS